MPITSIGHPWGGERESAKMTGLRLPPPCRGLRDQFSSVSWRTGSLDDAFRAFGERTKTAAVVLAFGRFPTSAVPNHQGNVSSPTRSRRRPTSSLFTRGHRDDQCGISSCLGIVWPEPARPRQGVASTPGARQGYAGAASSSQDPSGAPGPGQDLTGSSGSGQDLAGSSGSEQDCSGSSSSEQDHAGSSGSVQGHAGSSGSEQDHAGSSGSEQDCSGSLGA
jgi:hypothetical protein